MDPRQHRDLEMMRDPDRWPNIVLPMKRRSSGQLETGVLVAGVAGEYAWVPCANMFETVSPTDPRVVMNPDLEQIVAEGWMVD